jgi:hypothetical protein
MLICRRKETLQHLFRITSLAVQLTLKLLSNVDVNTDHKKIKGAFEFLKIVATCHSTSSLSQIPRAFSGYAFDKPPSSSHLAIFRFVLLGHYCRPPVFTRFSQIIRDYALLDGSRYPVLTMITLIGEVSLHIFKIYKQLKAVAKLKERLRIPDREIDLDDNFLQISKLEREIGKFIYGHLVKLIRMESNTLILSVAQLTMTTSFLRHLAIETGPLDTDEMTNSAPAIAAMQMTARLASEGFTTETKRRDLLEWTVSWYKRQMELDYGKAYKAVTEPDSVGVQGIVYLPRHFPTVNSDMLESYSGIDMFSIISPSIEFNLKHCR